MQENLQELILKNLIQNESYFRRAIPYLKEEYFTEHHKVVFHELKEYADKYSNPPSAEALSLEIDDSNYVNEENYERVIRLVDECKNPSDVEEQWLVDQSEQWCQDRAIHLAIMQSLEVFKGNDSKLDKGAIPKLLSDAIGTSFDPSIGHDYFENAEDRFNYYNTEQDKIAFDIDIFNDVTNGGVESKTLNMFMSPPHGCKTLTMCHLASSDLSQGKNVLYITMEMAEEKISERIDANLLDVEMDNIRKLSKDRFMNKAAKVQSRTNGKIFVKQFPTGAAHAGHFRALLNDLKIKKGFVPDVIYIDYLNICCSSRMRMGGSVNTYVYIKSIAEELRGLAVEFNVPIWSATQVNREGARASDFDATDTSESFGLPATVDLFWAIIITEELKRDNKIMIKQLKNRYKDMNYREKFMIGVDRSKMRIYDLDNPAVMTTPSSGAAPVETSPFGSKDKKEKNFQGFKF